MKLEACISAWNQTHDESLQLGSILTPAAERKWIKNTCERYKVIFRVLKFPVDEEDAFYCHLAALNFSSGRVSVQEEFYLSQGVVALPDSVFVMREAAYDPDVVERQKYLLKKIKHLIPKELVSEIGMIHEQISL